MADLVQFLPLSPVLSVLFDLFGQERS